MLDAEANQAKNSVSKEVQELKIELEDISQNLARLTDVYVAQDIERDDYLERRRSLMSSKKSLEEKIMQISKTPTMWIEPTREWIKEAQILDEISKTANLPSKKLSLQKIFGSNLILKGREASGNPFSHYAELRSARQNFAKKDETLIRVVLLNSARTYFKKNPTGNLNSKKVEVLLKHFLGRNPAKGR